MKQLTRRNFLSLSGGLAGYSLAVLAEDGAFTSPGMESSEADKRFQQAAPSGSTSRPWNSEPHMMPVELECDILVTGGGMSGVCAALAAARHGAKVVLVQDRSRLGGNASSEVKMHIVGADHHGGRSGWREGGIIEELRLEDAVRNPQCSFELWDLLLYDKVMREPNILLLLDSVVFAAAVDQGRLQHALVRCDKTEHLYRVQASLYIDCTGDGRLALEAGAEFRMGRESSQEFGESLGLQQADHKTLGSSILFTARDYGRPMRFQPPAWARKITARQLRFRSTPSWEYGYWWIEWGGQLNTIRDNERIRFELLAIVMGVWDYVKNSGQHPNSANWAMDWIGFLPGKRESRRILGDYILTQADLAQPNRAFDDAVAIGGWPMDDHPPSGMDAFDQRPFTPTPVPEVYNIPLRCLYSRKVENLMMAGRNLSASHVAFTSTRVMATCSVLGQAAGTAAALCAKTGITPRQLYHDKTRLIQLKQILLRDDQSIRFEKNTDPLDLARQARVAASSEYAESRAIHVIDGEVRDLPGRWDHRWAAVMTPASPWIELTWEQPVTLRTVQITFDTGFHRQLTLTASDTHNSKIIRAPQPETVRDYEITYQTETGGKWVPLLNVSGNYQRLNRHFFKPICARKLRLNVLATNGSDTARIYEIRCYEHSEQIS